MFPRPLAKESRNTVKLAKLEMDQTPRLSGSGLSEYAQRLAVLLNARSEAGLEYDPQLEPQEVAQALGFTDEELSIAADELEERGWVQLLKTSGMGKAGFSEISPTAQLFIEADTVLKEWTPRDDAKTLAAILVDKGNDRGMNLEALDQALGWGPRRLNPAAQFLVSQGYVQTIRVMGTHPYAFDELLITARTRRFGKES